MKSSLLILVFFASFIVRALRWLGFVQQKEYRLDRILLFLRSNEGIRELFRFFPKKTDFSKVGLKRPKMTARSILVFLIFLLFTALFFEVANSFGLDFMLRWYPYPRWYKLILLLVLMICYLITLPMFVMLSVLPTVLLSYIQTYKRLLQAKRLLDSSNSKIIGVTGSYGKTSTKMLLSYVLQKKYTVFVTPKSYNTKYSVANSVVQGYKGEDIAIIEYAAYKKGEIKELAKWIKPQIAIITGLAKQHVGLFGSLQEIIEAKSELVASLPKEAPVICNLYDEQTRRIYEAGRENNKAKLIPVEPENTTVKLANERLSSDGKLRFDWDGTTVETRLIGIQYMETVHLVIVTALQLKLTKEEIISALESFSPDEKFINIYNLVSGVRVLDDGDTCNPKGFSAIIKLAQSIKASKKVLITSGIVDLGRDSSNIHHALAKESKKVFDQVIYLGDSGKAEFESIFLDMLLTTSEQLGEVISNLGEEDLVVIEGRMPAWANQFLTV